MKTADQYMHTRTKLVRWLSHKPWAYRDAEDLAQDAYLACLELAAAGKKPRNYYYLSKEAARKQKLLPFWIKPTNSNKSSYLSATRAEMEQQIDYLQLAALPDQPDQSAVQSKITDTLDFVGKFCCQELKTAVQMMLDGETASQAAAQVGWRPDELSRALAEVGRALAGRQSRRRRKSMHDTQQMDLFGATQGVA